MKTSYYRNLPHWIPPNAKFFITFRLVNSLPLDVLHDLITENDRRQRAIEKDFTGPPRQQKLYELQKTYFGHFDAWLDRCVESSPHWLADERIASIVAEHIHQLDRVRYALLAYCIMPNHVHLLIDTSGFDLAPQHQGTTKAYPLADTLRLLKGATARYCNQVLGRTGAFWQPESYDHVVRDDRECERILDYIVNNPVKAGLVSHSREWKFTFVVEYNENTLS